MNYFNIKTKSHIFIDFDFKKKKNLFGYAIHQSHNEIILHDLNCKRDKSNNYNHQYNAHYLSDNILFIFSPIM